MLCEDEAGSSLASNVHAHALVLDGVYTTSSPTSPPIFRSATRLIQSEVETVQRDVTPRIASVLLPFHIHADPDCDRSPIPDSEDSLLPFLRAGSIPSRIALGPEAGH
ncbi:MAG: transposase [Planctomycetes bacterium]|nr:transposase [Planctomycetota bacterium]